MPDISELSFEDRLSPAPRTREDRPGTAPLPAPQGPRQAPPRRDHRRPQLQGPPRAGPLPRAPPRLRAVDQGRPDRARHRRDRVGKILSRLCVRPPGLPPRHLDALLPRLPPSRRTHPRPGRKARPAHPRRVELPARLLRELVEATLAKQLVQSRVERVVQRPDRAGRDEQLFLPITKHSAYCHRRHLSLRSLCPPNSTHSQGPRGTDFIHGLLASPLAYRLTDGSSLSQFPLK